MKETATEQVRNEKPRSLFLLLTFIGLCLLTALASINFLYPRQYEAHVLRYAREYNLDITLVNAVIRTESRFDPLALSPKDAKGLMQITDQTGLWAAQELELGFFTSDMLFEPEVNILIGCWYLRRLMDQYDQNVNLALAAYNAGSGNVSKWLGDTRYSVDGRNLTTIPFRETEKYLTRVKNAQFIYRYLKYIPAIEV